MNRIASTLLVVAGTLLLAVSASLAQNKVNTGNVPELALEVPSECLTNGTNDILGGWTTARRQRVSMFIPDPDFADPQIDFQCLVQVTRLGNPFAPVVVVGGGLGGTIPLGNPGFGATQFVIPSTSLAARLYAELFWPHLFGPRTHIALGVAGIYGSTVPRAVGNVGGGGTVATGGLDSHWGGVVYAAVERSIAPLINARLSLGAGVGQRTLNLTTGGVTAAQGSGTVALIEVGGEVFRRLNDNVDIGLGVFATRVGGINTNVGGTTVRLGPSVDARVMVHLRAVLNNLAIRPQPKRLSE
jgi:hypothetical protein